MERITNFNHVSIIFLDCKQEWYNRRSSIFRRQIHSGTQTEAAVLHGDVPYSMRPSIPHRPLRLPASSWRRGESRSQHHNLAFLRGLPVHADRLYARHVRIYPTDKYVLIYNYFILIFHSLILSPRIGIIYANWAWERTRIVFLMTHNEAYICDNYHGNLPVLCWCYAKMTGSDRASHKGSKLHPHVTTHKGGD